MNIFSAYKPATIDWLDEIPEHWNIYPFFVVFKEHKHKNKENIIKKVVTIQVD